MQDSIKKDITVKAGIEKVYSAITDPEKMTSWFPNAIEGSLEVGQRPIFDFGEHGKSSTYIVEAKPFEYFAYRWVPGGAQFVGDVLAVPNTLVEFFIEDLGSETKITVQESGFASLPIDVAEKSFNENSGGWDYMIGRLKKIVD